MGSTPSYVQRRERSDTKTLIRLGTERASAPGELSPEQRELLQEIARGDAGASRVQLWFQGVKEPVRARLRVRGDRIQVEASLAFLQIDSTVAVARSEHDGARIEGRIAQVSLESAAGEPARLCIELALPSELALAPGTDDTAPALRGGTSSRASRADVTDSTSTPPVSMAPSVTGRSSKWLPWTLAFALGTAGGAVGSWGWLAPWLRHPFALVAHPMHASSGIAPALHGGAAFAELPVAVPPLEAVPTATPQPELSADQLTALLAFPEPAGATDDTAAYTFAREPRADLITPVDAQPSFALERERPADEPGPETDLTVDPPGSEVREPSPISNLARGLEIKASEGLTEIIVPMQGNADGLERYVLTTPGIALTLPNAHARVPLENYATHRPLVRRVWLRHHEHGVQVRIIFPNADVRDEVRFDERGLHVLLRP